MSLLIHLPTLPLVLADSSMLKGLLPLLGIMLVLTSVMMSIRKRRRRGGTPITGREQLERLKQEKAMRGDLEELMVEIEQLARRFGAQLDAKTMQLERLLHEADQRIARLEQLQQEGLAGEHVGGVSGGERESVAFASVRAAARQGDLGRPSLTLGTLSPVRPERGRSAAGGAAVNGEDEPDALTRSVYALADEGLNARDIALRLSEHVGKVELMLALRKA